MQRLASKTRPYCCRSFKASSGLDMLAVQWISKAQAWQRTGRAGREAPGVCYRLYMEDEFDNLSENTTPEILRSESKVCLYHHALLARKYMLQHLFLFVFLLKIFLGYI